MPPADQIKVYKPAGSSLGWQVLGVLLTGGLGLGYVCSVASAGWSGLATGLLFIVMAVVCGVAIAQASVTIHEQGIVVRQYLRRRFIPWQAVELINTGERVAGISMAPRDNRNHPRSCGCTSAPASPTRRNGCG